VAGGLLARPALQVAQHDGGAVVVGQAAQLLIQQWPHVGPFVSWGGLGVGRYRDPRFPPPAPGVGPAGLQRRLAGDPVQPVGDLLPRRDGLGLRGEDEEGGLEGVLGVVVAEQASAHAPDHRPVPFDERGEGGLVAALDEAAEQLAVAEARAVAQRRRPKLFDHAGGRAGRHAPPRRASRPALYLLSAVRA
jgi:hypothetical protein